MNVDSLISEPSKPIAASVLAQLAKLFRSASRHPESALLHTAADKHLNAMIVAEAKLEQLWKTSTTEPLAIMQAALVTLEQAVKAHDDDAIETILRSVP